jgi:hypothetical protein
MKHDAQQLIKHDAEGILILRGTDDLSLDLLPTRVLRCHQSNAGLSFINVGILGRGAEELSDTEVERFTVPSSVTRALPGFRSDGRRGCARTKWRRKRAERSLAGRDVQFMFVAVDIDCTTVHIFHNEIRKALRGAAGIQKGGYMGMVEVGEICRSC